ncbi:LPS export ABC transporter periplasmic protein LptC [Paludibacterium sp. THUN1379]|uniref:LPS export ABC transporter periplasmic protein LptC n=1 Tax=Paludibacterium sp. THUN1379 TaxID=3112107 RepID=UPI003088D860|nr:LPS export ABC transporter periplasmic protein LptC [Paludibacterium sp. THUN1379]
MKSGHWTRLFPVALVALTALLTIWLDQVSKLGSFGHDLDPSQPEYVAEKIDATRFDEQGRVLQHMIADRLWQYPNQRELYFNQGNIALFKDGQLDYTLIADNGRYNTESRVAFLEHKAHLQKPAVAGQPPMTLDSSAMTVDTVRHYASSPMPTTVHYGSSVANSTGFNYDQKTGIVNMLSYAKATYVQ